LATPLFLIVSIALWFYALIPMLVALIVVEMSGSELERIIVSQSSFELFSRFIGSEGVLAVLRFSLIGIAVSAWMLPTESQERREGPYRHEAALPPVLVAAGFGIIATMIYVMRQYVPVNDFGSTWAEWNRHMGFAALAIFLASYALIAIRCVSHEGKAFIYLVFLSLVAIGPILLGGLKAVVFIFGAAGLAISLAWRSARFFVGTTILVIVALASVILMRQSTLVFTFGIVEAMARVVSAKLVARQVETVDCLTGVIRAASIDRGKLLSPIYFTAGLVPRAVWKEKPDLSQSGVTVIQYCEQRIAGSIRVGHSASATLLWEPLAQAGTHGQIVAQTLTFLILIILSRIWITSGSYAAAGVLALTPWTVDFDQHFALYVANLAKAGLVTGAFLFVLARVGRILRWR